MSYPFSERVFSRFKQYFSPISLSFQAILIPYWAIFSSNTSPPFGSFFQVKHLPYFRYCKMMGMVVTLHL